jgi:hypothetical protein
MVVLENKNCRERIKTVAGALGGLSFHLLRLLLADTVRRAYTEDPQYAAENPER